MIFRERHSSVTSGANPRSKSISKQFITNLLIFNYFVALCSAYGPYRPHRPHPPPWAWSTLAPLNQTYNATSTNVTTMLYEETTLTMPVADGDAIVFDNDEYNADLDDSAGTNADQVLLIRTTPPVPNVTVVTMPEFEQTEAVEQTEPPRTPEEELDLMLEDLDSLLSNESTVVTVLDVADTFDQLDVLLDADLEFPCSLLRSLDALGARVDLGLNCICQLVPESKPLAGAATAVTARRNVAVVMADSAPAHPVRGLRVVAANGLDGATFDILNDTVDSTFLSSDTSDAVVSLPPSLSDSPRRISFVVFASDRAFRRDSDHVVNSQVISVNVDNFTQLNEGEVIDIHFKPSILKPARNMSRACAYWHFTENGTGGYWSQEGCIFIHKPDGVLDICRCTHLTHFAEVLVPKAVFSESNEMALEIISLTGCFLSLFGLFIILLTATLFKSWRNDFNNKIWLQLTLALIINDICFLLIVFLKFEDYNMYCFFIGLLLHYAVLASFCWMLVAAIISYRKLVLIFARDPSRKLLKASAFSWFFPLALITVLVAVAPDSYARRFEQKTPNGAFCYPLGLGLWLTVYTPITIIVLTNWILFGLIIKSVFATRKIKKHGDSSEVLRRASVSCLLVFLFGLPWVFGLFAYNIVAAYLFTLTTSYQGFVLFIFFVIINTKTRGMWLARLRVTKKTTAPASSSLLTHRSEPVRDESEQPFIEPSSTRTNVTSLMSNSSTANAITYDTSRNSVVIPDSNEIYRDESDGSFKTAQSFGNIYEDEDNKSIPRVVGVIEKKHSEPDLFDYHFSRVKGIGLTNGKPPANDSVVLGLESNSNGVQGEIGVSDIVSGGDNSNGRESNHSHSHRSDNGSSSEIKVYNVPTQSASLIS